MTDLEKNLSILLDDRADEPVATAIDLASSDVNLQYRMRRHRMIGEVLRNEMPSTIDPTGSVRRKHVPKPSIAMR